MKRILMFTALALFVSGSAFAAGKSEKVKDANEAHSSAPAAVPQGAPTSGSPSTSPMATGEALQGLPSPEMTKWVTAMKACHKGGKNDQACHDRVVKGCQAKLTKEECAKLM